MRRKLLAATAAGLLVLGLAGGPGVSAQTVQDSEETDITATITTVDGVRVINPLSSGISLDANLAGTELNAGAVVVEVDEVAVAGADWTVTGKVCEPTSVLDPLGGFNCESHNLKRVLDDALLSAEHFAVTNLAAGALHDGDGSSAGAGGALGAGPVTLISAQQDENSAYTGLHVYEGDLEVDVENITLHGEFKGVWVLELIY